MASHRPLKPFMALVFLACGGQVLWSARGVWPPAHSGTRFSVPRGVTAPSAGSLALPSAAPGLAFLLGIGFAHASSVAALLHNVFVQLALFLANPAVKGTHNGGPGLPASAGSVPPSCAPYLHR